MLLGQGRDGGIGIAYAGHVSVFQWMPQPAARSAYLRQVERIAPPDPPGLLDRDAELAELARFCLDPDGPSYAWWRAGPWAGKSALLSTFVLHPPPEMAERVRFVSFFITARLAAQDTRQAFTEVVLEQLAALLGQSLPPVLPATREAYLLDLMCQSAIACQDAGWRLVLVVDGLDEDRGLTACPDAHSIAGLLPLDPPAGMRVIVAGRPHPPVPDDVPDRHPLRDPGIIRPLLPSRYAQAVKRLARQELKRLLGGSPSEQDLLGLVTAARGGLTARDLEELADIPLWEVEEILLATAGRTFRSRPSRYDVEARPDRYLLGHEELQAAATDYLASRLAGYRERLHSWAASYRARGWPPETPEYLLAGYFRLLENLGDLPRMIECALDAARHDRMLDLTGGDAAALAEARTVLDRIVAQDDPDLVSALALACHRDHLADRNAKIPVTLPAVWAILGQLPRARALAASIPDSNLQVSALAKLAEALAGAGQVRQAEDFAAQAEAIARSIAYPEWQVYALAEVAGALAGAGDVRQAEDFAARAEAIARSIAHPGVHEDALAEAARALAGAGQVGRAEAIARSIADQGVQASALARVAEALARAGQVRQAEDYAAQAEVIARSAADPYLQDSALAEAARALAGTGQVRRAEAIARSIAHPSFRASALAEVAGALAGAGQHQQAEVIVGLIAELGGQACALAKVALALAEAGQVRQAEDYAAQAEAIARSISYRDWRALAEVAGALAEAGQHQQAEEVIACSIPDPGDQARALAKVALALAGAGQVRQAEDYAAQAEAIARSITDPYLLDSALAEAARALAGTGQVRRAEAIARSIAHPHLQASALIEVAGALARAGQHQQAESIACSIADPTWQVSALAEIAGALGAAGQVRQAEDYAAQAEAIARSTPHPGVQEDALAEAARALAGAGQVRQAEAIARSIASPEWQGGALAEVAGALARAGQHQQAESIARSIADQGLRASALSQIAATLARAGDARSASRVAAATCAVGPWTTAVRPVLLLVPSAFTALARTLEGI